MCPTGSLLDGDVNGYRTVIIPLSISSPIVMDSVLAIAASHLKLQEPSFGPVALKYRGSTLKALQGLLGSNMQCISTLEILSTILMVCFFDISDGCQSNWVNHVLGASLIMQQPWSRENAGLDDWALSFIGHYFAAHSILAYTAIPESASEARLLESALYWIDKIKGPEDHIDCNLGCSKKLMMLIFEICHEIRERKKVRTRVLDNTCERSAARMDQRLQTLSQVVPEWSPLATFS